MSTIKALIVDDEYESRKTLHNFLLKYCHDIAILGEASSVAEAVALIKENSPELVFLDINMPAENGFELFNKLTDTDFYTVFVTAYDEYALQAFKHHALDYILKPIDIEELITTVNRIRKLRQDKHHAHQLNTLLEALKHPSNNPKIALPVMEGVLYVNSMDIVRCEASNNYTCIFLQDGKKILVSKGLGLYEELLERYRFVRVHHQHLVNLNYVAKYLRGRGGTIIMTDGTEIQVSHRKKEAFLKLIGADF